MRLEQARRDGFANGVASAHQEAEQALFPALQKLADSVAQTARTRDVIREQATDHLVRLALQIASRVLHRDVVLDSIVLAGLLKAAFSKLRSQEISVAHIHPALEPILRGCLERNGAPANLQLLADPKLRPGSLGFETSATEGSPAEIALSEIERGLSDRLIG
jgi:flagellar assembly protein FliH